VLQHAADRVDQLGEPASDADEEPHDSFHAVPARTAGVVIHSRSLPAAPGGLASGKPDAVPAAARNHPWQKRGRPRPGGERRSRARSGPGGKAHLHLSKKVSALPPESAWEGRIPA
jgi:hypothetical protein